MNPMGSNSFDRASLNSFSPRAGTNSSGEYPHPPRQIYSREHSLGGHPVLEAKHEA